MQSYRPDQTGVKGPAILRAMAKNSTPDAGFTLLEALAVLAIATLVMAIALPRVGSQSSPAKIEALAVQVMSALNADRYAARRRSMTMTTEIDLQANRIRTETRTTALILPSTLKLGTRLAPPCDPTGRKVIFYPDGTTCAPLIILSSLSATRVIHINPLSGAITLGE